MAKKSFITTLIAVFVICPRIAMGQKKLNVPIELNIGDPAPFAGVLYTKVAAMRITLKEQRCYDQAELEIKHVKNEAAADLSAERRKFEIERNENRLRIAILEQQLEEATAWYESPPVIIIVSAVVTATAIVVAALAIDVSDKIVVNK